MLRTRLIVGIVLLPLVVLVIMAGGAIYQLGVLGLLAIGVWELNRMMRAAGYIPSLLVSWLLLVVIVFAPERPDVLGPGVAAAILLAMAAALHAFYHGDKSPLNGFALGLGIPLYLGWLGVHLLTLRALPGGEWWTLIVIPCTFAADTGAYAIGTMWGRHKLASRISPKKTWEGYAGGVVFATFFGLLAGGMWGIHVPQMLPWHGAVIGLLIGLFSPLGDLAVSVFKRQVGIKDTGRLIPGHGGAMDRLDTVLIAAVLGYYFVTWLM